MAVRHRPRLRWAALAVIAVACSSPEPPAPAESETRDEPDPTEVTDREPEPVLPSIRPFDAQGDEAKALREIGAVPAWSALVGRDAFLARRGDSGIVYGRLGQHDGTWYLHDETAPRLCLGYRFEPPAGAPVSAGDRLVVWGAWEVDEDRRWVWKASKAEKLSSGAGDPPANPPLMVDAVSEAPEGAQVPSKRNGAGAIVFYVRSEPLAFGRGWSIADTPKGDHAARLLLPGERRPYGGQMPPIQEETWRLEKGEPYVLAVEKFRRREGRAPTLRAVSPPSRLTGPLPTAPDAGPTTDDR